jgi:hypothetical protein
MHYYSVFKDQPFSGRTETVPLDPIQSQCLGEDFERGFHRQRRKAPPHTNNTGRSPRSKVIGRTIFAELPRAFARFPRVCRHTTIRRDIDAFCSGPNPLQIAASQLAVGGFAEKLAREIAMRRLLSMAAFGFGFYYLWNNTDPTVEFASLGAIGLAILLEFAAPD